MNDTPSAAPSLKDQHAHDPIVLSVRLTSICPHGKPSNTCCGYAEWLQVIHAINKLAAEQQENYQPIATPLTSYEQSGGRWFEEYPSFRVIIRPDGTTNVQAKTADAAILLHDAVKQVTGMDVDANGFPR